MSDGGSEFSADTERVLKAFDVHHEVVPPSAKWRMGLVERHGAVLKLLTMKIMVATTARGFAEVSQCLITATSARNRQVRVGGFAPTQIVLGKDVAISSSLLQQLESGHFRYVVNQDLAFDAARRRNEQIRQAAEQTFIWADGNETMRKAINLGWNSYMKGPWSTFTIRWPTAKGSLGDYKIRRPGRDRGWWQRWREEMGPSVECGSGTAVS